MIGTKKDYIKTYTPEDIEQWIDSNTSFTFNTIKKKDIIENIPRYCHLKKVMNFIDYVVSATSGAITVGIAIYLIFLSPILSPANYILNKSLAIVSGISLLTFIISIFISAYIDVEKLQPIEKSLDYVDKEDIHVLRDKRIIVTNHPTKKATTKKMLVGENHNGKPKTITSTHRLNYATIINHVNSYSVNKNMINVQCDITRYYVEAVYNEDEFPPYDFTFHKVEYKDTSFLVPDIMKDRGCFTQCLERLM